jgi:hypothetical protein
MALGPFWVKIHVSGPHMFVHGGCPVISDLRCVAALHHRKSRKKMFNFAHANVILNIHVNVHTHTNANIHIHTHIHILVHIQMYLSTD